MSTVVSRNKQLKITTNIEGTPLTVSLDGKIKRVLRIYQQWQEPERICPQNIARTFFCIKFAGGIIADVYRDMTSNIWYLDKVHK